MNIDRRTFLRSSAGALVAAAVPPIPPCVHDWSPLRVCTKCGLTMERYYFDSKPIVPTVVPISIEGVFEMASGVLVTLPRDNEKVQAMINAKECIDHRPPPTKQAFMIPLSAVQWERSLTADLSDVEKNKLAIEVFNKYVGTCIDQPLPVAPAVDPHG